MSKKWTLTNIYLFRAIVITGFLLIRFADADVALAADATLRAKGIFLRQQNGAGLPHALRMTIGSELATRAAILALRRWKKGTQT